MKSVVLLLCLGAALAVPVPVKHNEPSIRSVETLAEGLVNTWGENRLSRSEASKIAEQQLQWVVENESNETVTVTFREPVPLVDCPALPKRDRPSSITDLHPQDIKVVGAIGDSISTGCNALSSSWLNMKDYEGLAWSMGGDDGVVTLPNILADYTDAVAPAHGTGSDNKGFNHAKNGAVVQDTPAQAANLIAAIKAHSGIDYENDWKVVTVLIGGNNLCDVCLSGKEADNNAATYEKYLHQTLSTLSTMPRTFVNLVGHADYTQIAKYKGFFCGIALSFVCDCLSSGDDSKLARARQEVAAFNQVLEKIAQDPKYRRDDFAVVFQHGLVNAVIPGDYLISRADCFHPSGEGQRFFATALWNSMIIPQSEKASFTATVDDVPKCADGNTRLRVD